MAERIYFYEDDLLLLTRYFERIGRMKDAEFVIVKVKFLRAQGRLATRDLK